jgi:hypothetical protein
VLLDGRPSDETLPCGGGWFSSDGGTGAYSRTVVGFDWGRFSEDGSTITTARTASARRINGG